MCPSGTVLVGCPALPRARGSAPRQEFIPHEFTLSFSHLEDRTVNSSITVTIFHGQRVVFLVRKKTNDSATPKWSGCLAYFHWQSANLHPFLTQKNMSHRSNVDLCDGLAALLKLQKIVLGQ
jgi:hypothetical protein